jgi:hypothetical protein
LAGFFPTLQREELFYSGVARYAAALGNPNAELVLDDLFSVHLAVAVDLPCRLRNFIKQLPGHSPYTVDGLIDQHTLYPYHSRFVEGEIDARARLLLEGPDGRRVHGILGLMTNRLRQPRFLLCCPECAREDHDAIGVCVWRRVHQLPGVFVCPDHETILHTTNVLRLTGIKTIALDMATVSASRPILVGAHVTHPLLLRLAHSSQWLLQNVGKSRGVADLRNRYRTVLAGNGWISDNGSIRMSKLMEALKDYVGSELLAQLGCGLPQGNPDFSWVARLLRAGSNSPGPPLPQLVLLAFLDLPASKFFELEPRPPSPVVPANSARRRVAARLRAPGAAPCANPVCEAYDANFCQALSRADLSPVVHEIECDRCGFVYRWSTDLPSKRITIRTGPVWDAALRAMVRDKVTMLATMAQHLGVCWHTVKRHARRLGVWRAGWVSNKKSGGRQSQQRKNANLLRRHRAIWRKIQVEHPNARRYQLRRVALQSYRYLLRHDANWLETNSPQKRRPGGRAVDWAERDARTTEFARRAIVERLNSKERPERICLGSIARWMGIEILDQKKLAVRMPHLAQLVASVHESTSEFERRKLVWAANRIIEEGNCPTAGHSR